MSEEQLSALLAKLEEDPDLRAKIKSSADLDSAVALAKDAGFNVIKEDFLRIRPDQATELGDDELATVAGGKIFSEIWTAIMNCL